MNDVIARTFDELWTQLAPIGRAADTGGYRRFAWTAADREAREWFTDAASRRGLDVQPDRNGNLWAWWMPEGMAEPRDAFVTGSHLDSVPDGGAFDGPLGVVSALCAIDLIRVRGVRPAKPVAAVVFADEEGARFGVACVGSRLLTGALEPALARALTDGEGSTLDTAMRRAGLAPEGLGRDDELLARVGAFVEVHIEQGRALADLGAAVGVATAIWPHGRWRFTFTGQANHAGTTRLADRHDPMLAFAAAVLSARDAAAEHGGVATVGRVRSVPNATNAVPSAVEAWLDARGESQQVVDAIVADVEKAARRRADDDGVDCEVSADSLTGRVEFASELRASVSGCLGGVPEIATGAGHDAGVLAAEVPTGMLFVRNRTGSSHAPDEFAERADCLAGVDALARVMAEWVS